VLGRHVVMLTGSDVEAHSDTAHGAGATAFLSKGRTADELVKVIRHLMALQAA